MISSHLEASSLRLRFPVCRVGDEVVGQNYIGDKRGRLPPQMGHIPRRRRRLSRAEAHKFLHYAGTRRGTSERDVAREKTASLSGSSDLISIVVTCRNADHDFDHHRAIDSERRDRERSCCSKTREHGRAQGARVGACATSRRQPRSTPCRVGASFGSSGGSGVVQTSCRATPFQALLRIPEIAS